MTKRKKTSEIEGKKARFSNMVTVISLITLVFTSRGMKKVDIAKICKNSLLTHWYWAKMGQNPEKKLLTSFSRKHDFTQLPHRSLDNSVSFSPNHFKFSVIGPN